MDKLERNGFVIFASREVQLMMRALLPRQLNSYEEGICVDFRPVKQRWDTMSGRKKNIYNKRAEKQGTLIKRVETDSEIAKTPFYYYSKVIGALSEDDQKKGWLQLPTEGKREYYNKAEENRKNIVKRPHPLPQIKNGICRLWTAFDFYKDAIRKEFISQYPDITNDLFNASAANFWRNLQKPQQEEYHKLEYQEIEAVAAVCYREGMYTRPDPCLRYILSHINEPRKPQYSYSSKYWSFVDGSICDLYDDSDTDPDELAEIACQVWDEIYPKMKEKEIMDKEDIKKRALQHKIPKKFLESFTELMWRIRAESPMNNIARYAEECWENMTEAEKQHFMKSAALTEEEERNA